MKYRRLGKTGLQVSEIGLGLWAIGGDAWGPVDDHESLSAIARAITGAHWSGPRFFALTSEGRS